MKVGSTFSGVGGIDLGLEWAGMEIVYQSEIDPFCRSVLRHHWPDVTLYGDIREIDASELEPVDLICGGVPCQPASVAGRRGGKDDERWLWDSFLRLVRATMPGWVLAENVPGLVSLDDGAFDGILCELEDAGYELLTFIAGADSVGAPHRRDRVWIVGRLVHPGGEQSQRGRAAGIVAGAAGAAEENSEQWQRMRNAADDPVQAGAVADALRKRRPAIGSVQSWQPDAQGSVQLADPEVCRRSREGQRRQSQFTGLGPACESGRIARWPARPGQPQHEWEPPRLRQFERRMGGNPARVPARLDGRRNRERLRALGNAVVPAVVAAIGRAIIEAEEQQ